ncbi:MAG: hypothetical protein NTW87_15310 [Planctomycetota bacterium]|nr:hypothetical protein [Planctomycetota bacterium]
MRRTLFIPCILAAWLGTAGQARSGTADKHPHIGYIYPAGGQRGTTFEVKTGGEDIYGATAAIVSGKGVSVLVTDSKDPAAGTEKNKKQRKKNQTVIDEIVTLKITMARDAEPVSREICLVTPDGLTNKLIFQVGELKEVRETEPNNKRDVAVPLPPLPVVANGQIMPGDVDMFKFSAKRGQHLVIEASARALIPYIADAVPGWFQAILSLYDAQGKEVAVADEFRFNQDPVLFYDVPANGEYTLEIRDSIYRGREDFVYRVRIGELPFITSVSPLGAPRGDKPVTVQLCGKNIPMTSTTVAVDQAAPSVQYVSVTTGGLTSNRVPFAVGDLPEISATEAASREGQAQEVTLPVVINGCIRAPAEKDSYCFGGKKGQAVCLEVRARRLGSPLDSCVVLLNSRGEKIGENDDIKDKGEGLLTHVADSELVCTLPEDGTYTARIFDTQGKGGSEYAYRLRISPPAPDFELRATPSAVSVPKGGSAQLTVHAIRKDGFTGEIALALDEPSSGLCLDGAGIPQGTDRVRVTISATEKAAVATIVPTLRGTATVDGKTVSRVALPAEDLMQAFIYQHLVPCKEQVVMVTKPAAPFSISARLPASGCLELPLGKEVVFPITVIRGKGFDGPIRVQLVDAPKGVTLKRGWIAAGKNSGQVAVQADEKVEAKLRENMILSGTMTLEKPGSGTPAPAAPSAKPAEKKAPDKPAPAPAPAAKPDPAPAANNPSSKNAPKPDEKKTADDAMTEFRIAPRTDAAPGADDKTGKPTPPPPPPPPTPAKVQPPPAKANNAPPPERVTVLLPAVPFRMVDNPELNAKAKTQNEK